jgi:hypothetical protein
MRPFRYSIAAMMGLVAIAAIGAAILRQGLEVSAAVVYLITGATLSLAIVGLVCRDERERTWWLGVNLFGWGYWTMRARWAWCFLPTTGLLNSIGPCIGLPPVNSEFDLEREPWYTFLELTRFLSVLVAALLGGMLARALMRAGVSLSNEAATQARPATLLWPRWWARPVIILVTEFVLVTISAIAGSRLASGFWAGTTCMLTWGLVGLACVGAIVCRGKPREIYLGAGLFGLSFMLAIFTRLPDPNVMPRPWELPIEPFLNSLSLVVSPVLSGAPTASPQVAAANARIFRALERKVPVRFTDVALGEFLNYIRETTKDRDGRGIPVYIDPVGIQEYEKTLDAKITIDLIGSLLKRNLDAAMSQLEVKYAVRDGLLLIAVPREEELTIYFDPYQVVSACLLALIAMALGGALGPVVCAFPRRPAG